MTEKPIDEDEIVEIYPSYRWDCPQCGCVWDIEIEDEPVVTCEECGSRFKTS